MKLDYGKHGIEINLDPSWNITILHPIKQTVIENPVETIREKIKHPLGSPPLREIVEKNGGKVMTIDPVEGLSTTELIGRIQTRRRD